MSTFPVSLNVSRKLAFAALLGATCLASPLAIAQAPDYSSSQTTTTTTTNVPPPVTNQYSTTTTSKSIDPYGAETVKNKSYTSGPDGTRATSTTEVQTPDGGSMTTTHEEHTNPATSTTTTSRSSVSSDTYAH
jgi:hypothetical protein